MKQETRKEFFTTPHGTKYEIIHEDFVRVHVDFTVNLKRLLLFEEFCNVTGELFDFVVKDAIWEKMDSNIRDANIEQIGRYIKEQYLEKWDPKADKIHSNKLQDPVK
jgi:hypothetical protein